MCLRDTPLLTVMIRARHALPLLLPLQNTCAVAGRTWVFFRALGGLRTYFGAGSGGAFGANPNS
jgi:hypothetical protein